MKAVVIGAGIVGLAVASRLQAEGRAVTLLDPRPPGEHCSFGNAGCFSRASFVPMGMPGLWKKVPGWLADPLGPLSIPPAYLHRIAPWLWRFHRASDLANVHRIADALQPLLARTFDAWRPLAERAGAAHLIVQQGWAVGYESEAAYRGDALGRKIRGDRGVRMETLEGAAIRAFDPALSRTLTHLVVFPEQGHCSHPLALSQALAARLRAGGATFVEAAATGFDLVDGKVTAVRAGDRVIAADQVVLAAGAHSKPLAAQLGADVPLETERGYHVTLQQPSVVPRIPTMSGEGKFFATPMECGLRVAGSVELGGLDAPANMARADALLQGVHRLLDGLTHGEVTRWMGHRPSLPDSMPVIDRAPRAANAILAFGHGHVGLTAAAPTAEIVADLFAGRAATVPIEAFSARRF